MQRPTLIIVFILWFAPFLFGQVNYTAKDAIQPYTGGFRAGANFGLYPGFTDEMLGDLAAGRPELGIPGVGVKTLRPGLFEEFTYNWGYDLRIPTFQHYQNIGLEDNTVIIGFPAEAHRDQSQYCPNFRSELFANLYEPIWDNGENGTPINENNYYATYLWNVVTRYQDYARFYEIWNEPGFDYTGALGWFERGEPGNWWDNNPQPCDYKLRAPIFHYIRTLRISYDIIKTVDPDAYVVISGLGYPSFLDAILRNTDNPDNGAVSPDYPHRGGAYFDVMGFHSYPHFDGSLREWNNDIGWFQYFRHSDAAVQGIVDRQAMFQGVLDNYGYDGTTFPKKLSTITECNIPRKAFGEYIGGKEAQRNFIIKAVAACIQNNIEQLHVFQISERTPYEEASHEFDVMGLYEKLNASNGYFQTPTDEGTALRTTTTMLFGKEYDANTTAALQLPPNVGGGAFQDEAGNITYLLWAKTETDRSEVATANFSFPLPLGVATLQRKEWNFSESLQESTISSQNITLTATPSFFTEKTFTVDLSEVCAPATVSFADESGTVAASWEWTFEGGSPATSTQPNPSVTYATAGNYTVQLIARDANGNVVTNQNREITIKRIPQADFILNTLGTVVEVDNNTDPFAEEFLWEFGDGFTSSEQNPRHVYAFNGNYTVSLTVSNECGSTTATANVNVTTASTSQLNYTANDSVPLYEEFRPGTNLNYYPPWTDEQLADIAAGNPILGIPGAGVKTLRTQLPEEFTNFWGYDVRVSTFQHYNELGLKDNAVIVGYPSLEKREDKQYCPNTPSALFRDMYLDIWDDGSDGTPINEDNDYANYLYNLVIRYQDYVKFWEIWNTPDLDFTGERGWREPGEPGNWWDNNPEPCEYELNAPITHYVRMLRISYEVIKTLDPDAFVTISGIGYPSFLDAVLRNTDNPLDGSISEDYPLGGGAYFDAFGYTALPHLDGSTRFYNPDIQNFSFRRHSDAAVNGVMDLKEKFQEVFESYGYGLSFPEKKWLISKTNVPRKIFQNYLGGEEVQRNYLMKAYVEAVQNDIQQFQVYQIAEEATLAEAQGPLEVMGLFEKLTGIPPYQQSKTTAGIGFTTTSDLLFDKKLDAVQTAALQLPDHIRGAAFRANDGRFTYVLWAKTMTDYSENATATYTFPANLDLNLLERRYWNFSETGAMETIAPNSISLNATPVFLTEFSAVLPNPLANFTATPTSGCPGLEVRFVDLSENATSWNWSFPGAVPATSTEQNPTVIYPNSGNYEVSLTVSNETGQSTVSMPNFIELLPLPTAEFTVNQIGNSISLNNLSSNATSYFWSFGDGNVSTDENPTYQYMQNGLYAIQLLAYNGNCPADTFSTTINIAENMLVAAFNAENTIGCPPLNVAFNNLSSNGLTYEWHFPGGDTIRSEETHPVVVYDSSGMYDVTLIVFNNGRSDTTTLENFITVREAALADFDYTATGFTINFANLSQLGESYLWDFGDGMTSTEVNPVHTYENAEGQTYSVSLTVSNSTCEPAVLERLISFAPPSLPSFETVNSSGCPGLEVQFFDRSENVTDWNWSFPGGTPSTSTEQHPVIIYEYPGNYSVTLGVSNASASNALTFVNVVQVDTGAIADFSWVTEGPDVIFENTSQYALEYEWLFGDSTGTSSVAHTHRYPDNGDYQVLLAAFNTTCGWDTLVQTVNVSAPPIANFSFTAAEDCDDLTVEFADTSAYSPTSWLWTFPGGVPFRSTLPNPEVYYGKTGDYKAILVVTNEGGSDTLGQWVNVQTHEQREEIFTICAGDYITVNGTVYDEDKRVGIETLTSNSPNSCDTTIFVQLHVLESHKQRIKDTIINGEIYMLGEQALTQAGKYRADLTASNGCDSIVILDLMVLPVPGAAEMPIAVSATAKEFFQTLIQPNPFVQKTAIAFELNTEEKIEVAIYNTHGQLVEQLLIPTVLEIGQQEIIWNNAGVAPGVYWVKVGNGAQVDWKKVVKIGAVE